MSDDMRVSPQSTILRPDSGYYGDRTLTNCQHPPSPALSYAASRTLLSPSKLDSPPPPNIQLNLPICWNWKSIKICDDMILPGLTRPTSQLLTSPLSDVWTDSKVPTRNLIESEHYIIKAFPLLAINFCYQKNVLLTSFFLTINLKLFLLIKTSIINNFGKSQVQFGEPEIFG